MKKHGITIDCPNCRFVGQQEADRFDVVVPVVDDETGTHGDARLRCRATPQAHTITITEWISTDLPVIPHSGGLRKRLSATIDVVAEKRLCGNRSLCPEEVVAIVEKSDSD